MITEKTKLIKKEHKTNEQMFPVCNKYETKQINKFPKLILKISIRNCFF